MRGDLKAGDRLQHAASRLQSCLGVVVQGFGTACFIDYKRGLVAELVGQGGLAGSCGYLPAHGFGILGNIPVHADRLFLNGFEILDH